MKHWRNNWEKFVGRKLQDTEVQPQDHVWELIEQELNTQQAASKSNTYKAIAALVVLLLMTSSSLLLLNNPNGELAYNNEKLIIPHFNTNKIIASSADTPFSINISTAINKELQEREERLSLTASTTSSIVESNLVYSEIRSNRDNVDEPSNSNVTENIKQQQSIYSSIPLNKIEKGIVNRLDFDISSVIENIHGKKYNAIHLDPLAKNSNYNFIVSTEAITTQIMVSEYKAIDLDPNSAFIVANSMNIESNGVLPFTSTLFAIEPYQLPELDNTLILENDVIVSNTKPLLKADQNINHLNVSKASIINQSINATSQLAYNKEALMENDIIVSAVVEQEEMIESESSWLAEAMEEFNDWKETVESSKQEEQLKKQMDDQIEENLVDEAILDEEDPLTKLQNAQKDLFYASNIHKGFHIGLVTGVHNTWVARASRNSEVNRDDVEYRFTPGCQFGLNFGYDFGKNFGVMAELKFSDEGAKYYNPVVNRDEHIDLKYIEVPVYLKLKHNMTSSRNNNPMVFNYMLGATFKDLRRVKATVNEDVEKRFAQDYNTSEWGISAGFDFDIYTNRNLFWTFGVRAGASGWSKSFPRFKGEELGTITYTTGLFTRINFRKPTK